MREIYPFPTKKCNCGDKSKLMGTTHYAPHWDEKWSQEQKMSFKMGLFMLRTGVHIEVHEHPVSGYWMSINGWKWYCHDLPVLTDLLGGIASGIQLERQRVKALASAE